MPPLLQRLRWKRATRRSEVIAMKSFRALLGVCLPLVAAAVAGVIILSALTSWWVLFALFGVPPALMMVSGAVMLRTGGSFARFCAEMPCASWLRGDGARRAASPTGLR
jgi:hypothetical protein